jgi:hypothetical protein
LFWQIAAPIWSRPGLPCCLGKQAPPKKIKKLGSNFYPFPQRDRLKTSTKNSQGEPPPLARAAKTKKLYLLIADSVAAAAAAAAAAAIDQARTSVRRKRRLANENDIAKN